MKISEIDKNLAVSSAITQTDIEWYDVNEAPFEVCGVFYDKDEGAYLRFPREVSKTVSKVCLGMQDSRCSSVTKPVFPQPVSIRL